MILNIKYNEKVFISSLFIPFLSFSVLFSEYRLE